jgi:hypothetical protein
LEIINSILTQPLWSVLTGLVGFYFGQRFSLWRDRRKEFNELADALFVKLSKERENDWAMCCIANIEMETFARRLPIYNRAGFSRCKEEYYKAKSDNIGIDEYGGRFYHDTTSIITAIDGLLKFTERK